MYQNMNSCKSEQTSLFTSIKILNNLLLVIFCNQGYLRYKNKSPNSTLELGEIIRLNNVKRVQGDPNRLRVSYFYEVGEISYDKETDSLSNYTKLFDIQLTRAQIMANVNVEDYMMIDENIGVAKLTNN